MGRAILGMILSLLGIGGNLSSEVHAETVRYQDLTVTYEGQLIKITAQTNPSTGFDYKVKDYDATAVSVLPASYYMDEKDLQPTGLILPPMTDLMLPTSVFLMPEPRKRKLSAMNV